MKREIKFRGKSTFNNQDWVYGSFALVDDTPSIISESMSWEDGSEMILNDWSYIHKETLCQFTGLYDKNGKDIYEGDIIQLQGRENKYNCLVDWNINLGAWCISIEDKYVGVKPLGEWLCEDKFEVIGNIYDNPELLED